MTSTKPLIFDPYKKNRQTGSFILIDPITHNTVAVGMILDKLSSNNLPSRITDKDRKHIIKSGSLISLKQREKRYDQKAQTIWITGLHGSGKNELAYSLEKELFDMGKTIVVLDGKSVRSGLSIELDYSPADRAEHLRRVAHICKLLNEQGIITICSFISPAENIRTQVAEIIGEEKFNLIYLKCDINYAKKNDNYGLYKQAEEGKLKNLPGIDNVYEEPLNADIILPAEENGKNIEKIIEFLEGKNPI